MPSKQSKLHRGHRPEEILSRYISIDRWSASLHFSVEKPRGLPPERRTLRCLEFFGTLDEPLKGLTDVRGSIFPADEVTVGRNVEPSVASILSLREWVDIATHVTNQEFTWLLTMATGNALGGAYMAFRKPRYGHALIISLSFSSQLPLVEER
jgi:hypothetical protein